MMERKWENSQKVVTLQPFSKLFCALSVEIYAFPYSIALYWRENNGSFDVGNFIVMFWIKEREMLRD